MLDTIKLLEEKLKEAMLTSNVTLLDELLHEGLIFTNHLGHIMSKQDDLKAHNSGLLMINHIQTSEEQIRLYDNFAIVNVRTRIDGSFAGNAAVNDFRFTRIWSCQNDLWQLVAAQSSLISE